MIITRKIKLHVKNKEHWSFIHQLSNQIWRMANTIMTQQALNDTFIDRIIMTDEDMAKESEKLTKAIDREYKKEKPDEKKINSLKKQKSTLSKQAREKAKEYYLTSEQNTTYRIISKEYPGIPSETRAALNQDIYKQFSNDFIEVKQGKRTLRSYKKGMPIPITKKQMKLSNSADGMILFNKIDVDFLYGRDKSNNRQIIKRIIEGQYTLKNSKLHVKGKELFLLLSVDIPNKQANVDRSIIAGVDLGVAIPAYIALEKGYARQPIGDIKEFNKQRLRLQAQRKSIQRSVKYAKGGHGRKRKLKALETMKAKERKFVQTKNHQYSHAIIDFCLKYRAGTLRMENLSGFGDVRNNKFVLRNWSYYELQQYIEYKAKRNGIRVEKVEPAYTSKTCHKCGKRGERKEQATFKCVNPECMINEMNADYNAALNIAGGGVDVEKAKEVSKQQKLLPFDVVRSPAE